VQVLDFLPTAIQFDQTPNKAYVQGFFLAGMAVLASTLVVEGV